MSVSTAQVIEGLHAIREADQRVVLLTALRRFP